MSDISDQVQTDNEADARLIEGIKQRLDHSCEVLDARTISRLNTSRHIALEGRAKRFNPLWLSFGGMVTASFLVFSLNFSFLSQSGFVKDVKEAATLEDIEILTTTETLDFYEEYEFYQWLAESGSI